MIRMARALVVLMAMVAILFSGVSEAYPAGGGTPALAAGPRCPHAGVCPLKKEKGRRVVAGHHGAREKDRGGCAVIECHRESKSASSFHANEMPFITGNAVQPVYAGPPMPVQAALPGLYKGPYHSRPDRPPSIPRQT
jgi:hypothetical protein